MKIIKTPEQWKLYLESFILRVGLGEHHPSKPPSFPCIVNTNFDDRGLFNQAQHTFLTKEELQEFLK